MSERKKFLLALALTVSFVILSAVPTYAVLHRKANYPGLLSNMPEREYNAVIAKTQEYDALILGTSMSECFKCSELDRQMDCRSLKMTVNGANLAEIRFMAEYAAKFKKIKLALIDFHLLLHVPGFDMSCDHNLKLFPMEHYGKYSYLIPLKRAFSISGMAEALDFAKDIRKGRIKETSRDDIYNWGLRRPCGEKYFAADVLSKKAPQINIDDTFRKKTINNFRKHLLELVKAYPDTKFILFFPPNSALQYSNIDAAEYIKYKRQAIELFAGVKNVELYDFQTAFDITDNFENFKDREHYSPAINSWIISNLGKKEYLITPQNRERLLSGLQAHLQNYDHNAAYKRLKEKYGRK
ncbi:MAG: hypothetical protein IKD29_06315 [Lentisphaeria bacterium]|nr:hypothetical protein [Lentisphaeria bacterium]